MIFKLKPAKYEDVPVYTVYCILLDINKKRPSFETSQYNYLTLVNNNSLLLYDVILSFRIDLVA